MTGVRYAADKPKDCRYCYFWEGKQKDCSLTEERCYYILPPKEEKKPASPCDGCPYSRPNPCIGFCMRNIIASSKKGAAR